MSHKNRMRIIHKPLNRTCDVIWYSCVHSCVCVFVCVSVCERERWITHRGSGKAAGSQTGVLGFSSWSTCPFSSIDSICSSSDQILTTWQSNERPVELTLHHKSLTHTYTHNDFTWLPSFSAWISEQNHVADDLASNLYLYKHTGPYIVLHTAYVRVIFMIHFPKEKKKKSL